MQNQIKTDQAAPVDARYERDRRINSSKLREWVKVNVTQAPKKLDDIWEQLSSLSGLDDIAMSVALDDLEAFGIISLDDWQGDTLISLNSVGRG